MRNVFFVISIIVFSTLLSCGDTVTLTYDEKSQGSILSVDPSISPEENVEKYVTQSNLSFSKLRIYNESGGTCACTITGGNCKCKLPNSKNGNTCEDSNSKCTLNKVIKIQVDPNDIHLFEKVGFNK